MTDNPVPAADTVPPAPPAAQGEHMIPKSRLDEVLAKNAELANTLASIEAERKKETEKRLVEQQEWQKIAEQRGAELADAQGKVAKLSDYEKTLEKLLAAEVSQIPEAKRGLLPDEMTTVQKLNWIAKNKPILTAPATFDIGAGKVGGGESGATALTPEELAYARQFGVKPEDYAKHKFQ